jgi:hypothetical protein
MEDSQMIHISEESRRKMVAEAAYFRAEKRGFRDGSEVQDWLAAEQEIGAAPAGSLEERLAMANERLKAFRKRLVDKSHKAGQEWEDDLATLAKYRDRLRKRIRQAREESGHAAEKARIKAEETWEEIAALAERLGRRKGGKSATRK